MKKLIWSAITTLGVMAIPTLPVMAATHTVEPGQTLWTISQANHVSLQAMLNANPSVDPTNLQIGQSVNVPTAKAGLLSTQTQSSNQALLASDSSLLWMARIIQAEASGQSMKAKVAVGDVVLHRVQSSNYPDTVKGVIFQITDGYYQFTPVLNGHIYNTPSNKSVQAAKKVLDQSVDYVPGAYVFFTPSKTPNASWVWSQPRVAHIDNFIFAR